MKEYPKKPVCSLRRFGVIFSTHKMLQSRQGLFWGRKQLWSNNVLLQTGLSVSHNGHINANVWIIYSYNRVDNPNMIVKYNEHLWRKTNWQLSKHYKMSIFIKSMYTWNQERSSLLRQTVGPALFAYTKCWNNAKLCGSLRNSFVASVLILSEDMNKSVSLRCYL